MEMDNVSIFGESSKIMQEAEGKRHGEEYPEAATTADLDPSIYFVTPSAFFLTNQDLHICLIVQAFCYLLDYPFDTPNFRWI